MLAVCVVLTVYFLIGPKPTPIGGGGGAASRTLPEPAMSAKSVNEENRSSRSPEPTVQTQVSSVQAPKPPARTVEPVVAPSPPTPAPLPAVSPEEAQKVEIERLLTGAAKDLEAARLSSPEGKNALEKYRQVLVLDAANAQAKAGLAQIVSKYLGLSDDAAGKGDFTRAESYLSKAKGIVPDAEVLRTAGERIIEMKKVKAEQDRIAGEKAETERRFAAEQAAQARLAAEKAEAEKRQTFEQHMAASRQALSAKDENSVTWTIQVFVVKDSSEADRIIERLRQQGYPATKHSTEVPGKGT